MPIQSGSGVAGFPTGDLSLDTPGRQKHITLLGSRFHHLVFILPGLARSRTGPVLLSGLGVELEEHWVLSVSPEVPCISVHGVSTFRAQCVESVNSPAHPVEGPAAGTPQDVCYFLRPQCRSWGRGVPCKPC